MGKALGAGQRNAGELALAALDGPAPPAAFATLDDYIRAAAEIQGATFEQAMASPDFVEAVTKSWNDPLLSGHEAYFRVGAGHAQPCHGDSGGPVLRTDSKGKRRIYGVNARVLISNGTDFCSNGLIATTFGPKVRAFVADALACDKIPLVGACEGTTAVRCTKPGEGPQRVVKTNCANLGLACGAGDDGRIGCVDG